jgi:hypothetical protein
MEEILERPKFTVSGRVKKHCTGCGIAFYQEMLLEPQCFENTRLITVQFESIISNLLKQACPRCKEKTEQVDWFMSST